MGQVCQGALCLGLGLGLGNSEKGTTPARGGNRDASNSIDNLPDCMSWTKSRTTCTRQRRMASPPARCLDVTPANGAMHQSMAVSWNLETKEFLKTSGAD
jgi:hypothetical protein